MYCIDLGSGQCHLLFSLSKICTQLLGGARVSIHIWEFLKVFENRYLAKILASFM